MTAVPSAHIGMLLPDLASSEGPAFICLRLLVTPVQSFSSPSKMSISLRHSLLNGDQPRYLLKNGLLHNDLRGGISIDFPLPASVFTWGMHSMLASR
jgi:hypothetical protein